MTLGAIGWSMENDAVERDGLAKVKLNFLENEREVEEQAEFRVFGCEIRRRSMQHKLIMLLISQIHVFNAANETQIGG